MRTPYKPELTDTEEVEVSAVKVGEMSSKESGTCRQLSDCDSNRAFRSCPTRSAVAAVVISSPVQIAFAGSGIDVTIAVFVTGGVAASGAFTGAVLAPVSSDANTQAYIFCVGSAEYALERTVGTNPLLRKPFGELLTQELSRPRGKVKDRLAVVSISRQYNISSV